MISSGLYVFLGIVTPPRVSLALSLCLVSFLGVRSIHAFELFADFWHWLETNHDSEPELWLKIFKKGSGQAMINWEEAVIKALCWGWTV